MLILKFWVFFKVFFFKCLFYCISVLQACMSLCHLHSPEDVTGSPGME